MALSIPAPFCHTVHPLLGPVDDVVERLVDALKERGFVVLSRVALHEALVDSLQINPCVIISTCHPSHAARALRAERDAVVLLPMNIAVRQEENGNVSVVFEAPEALTTLLNAPEFAQIATGLSEHMRSLIASLFAQSCSEASRCHSLATSRCHSPTSTTTDTDAGPKDAHDHDESNSQQKRASNDGTHLAVPKISGS
eukprot:m.36915 g.36915  ORF g.36915 m.36915 type:complete len:198 (+) comp9738_c0_seq1:697-1290(+)